MTVVAGLFVANCGESQDNIRLVQFQAVSACADRAFAKLGINAEDEVVLGTRGAVEPSFRIASTGQFVAKLSPFVLKGDDRTIIATCTGDFNRRTLSSLQINGTIHRPAKAEEWTF